MPTESLSMRHIRDLLRLKHENGLSTRLIHMRSFPTFSIKVIPIGADQYPWAQSLRPMAMMRQG